MGAKRTRGKRPRIRKGGSEALRHGSTSYFAAKSTPEFLDETIAFWGPKYGRELTREDARQIIENMTGFFKLLHEWDEEDRRAQKQADVANAAPVSSTESGASG
ncbi:hypothetical protein [Bradyrhizobium sp. WSM2254]|uniref:hypothetical protein n=1 Tax=Bradyrhizobium sp. WSM2254 TaxID=1188263 RepID=UPI00041621A9|nr:hypothetical protein [Bradyrhizobium sp. WSM2254]